MVALRIAEAAGADYVELDVHRDADDDLVVIHDESLERTTDGSGPVAELDARRLATLDAGSWFGPAFTGEQVPRLADVLDWLAEDRPGRSVPLGAVIEAKGRATGAPLAAAIQEAGLADRVAICSFDLSELCAAAAAVPAIVRMLIVDRDRPQDDPVVGARACAATMVNVPWTWLQRSDVDRLHASGLLVAGGTADTPDAIDRASRLGLDAIDSNDPAMAVRSRQLALERGAAEDALTCD